MFCKKCGKEIPHDSIFCMYCGAGLTAQDSPTNQVKYEVVNLVVTWDGSAFVRNLTFKTKEPLFSQIKQLLDVYMKNTLEKEKYYKSYLRKSSKLHKNHAETILFYNGFLTHMVNEGLKSIFDQLGFDMRVESSVQKSIPFSNETGTQTTYRFKR